MAYIVVATSNAHKVEEYAKLLEGQKVELKSLLDYPNFPGVEEDGATFRENAAKKALAACRYCDVPAFADDSGLEVEALEGRPGIFSARYAPTDKERIAKLLEELKAPTSYTPLVLGLVTDLPQGAAAAASLALIAAGTALDYLRRRSELKSEPMYYLHRLRRLTRRSGG